MQLSSRVAGLVLLLFGGCGAAYADNYSDTITVFRKAGESADFFHHSYGYAVFPTVGEGGFIVGAAVGKGRVYSHHHLLGDTTMTQLSAGFQAGGKAYSQIIFFENKAALDTFRNGKFEFSAGASATAITASVGASVGTTGATSNASGTVNNATSAGSYVNGMAVFTVAKGGLMYAATLAGQKYSYKARGASQPTKES
jgi:lipid-binding SYLF domain-containing protein